jgi:tetratricopeptide (TPR) repeat protein
LTGSGITPSPNRARPPNFHEMDADAFERLTCALMDKVTDVTRADLYAVQHQPQYGIDVFGDTDTGLIVASCKCHVTVKKGEVAQWCADFLDHWESHWRAKKVRRFILVVAAAMNSHQRLADIEAARALFDTYGVAFDVWAPTQLQERLRDQPGIVSTYLGAEFVERLCGRQLALPFGAGAPPSGAAAAHSADQLNALIKALTGEVEKRLKRAREDLERGAVSDVEAALVELRQGTSWSSIEARVQAQAVRLQASLAIERGNLKQAEAFADEADTIAASEEPRLRSLLTFYEHGAERALETLGLPSTDAGRRLQASFLLQLERFAEADAILEQSPKDGEYFRLRAYALLVRGQARDALASAEQAEALQGDRLAVVRIGAIARYASALSPRVAPQFMTNPQPLGRAFVRSDAGSVRGLELAEAAFARLASIEVDPEAVENDKLWRLACVSNLEGRLSEAEALCGELLAANPMHVGAIAWGISRNLTFDRERSRTALQEALDSGAIPADGVRAIEWLWPEEEGEELKRVLGAAKAAGTSFSVDANRELDAILNRLTHPPQDDEPQAQLNIMERARTEAAWGKAEALFDRLAARGDFQPGLLYIAEELAGVDRWVFINDRRATIMSFGTASAARLAIFAAINAGDPQGALELIDQHRHAFSSDRLPSDIRRVEAAALNMLGEAPMALERAAALAAESASPADRLLEAQLRLVMGDLSGAAPALRRVLAEGELDPRAALHWAGRLAASEPQLARDLWRNAVERPLDDHTSIAAFHLSFRLGLEDEHPELYGALHRVAATDPKLIRMASIEDVVEEMKKGRERLDHLSRLYQIGAGPIHVLADAANGDLPSLYQLQVKPAPAPIYIRHGARDFLIEYEKPIEQWHLRIDVTGLLVADAIGLLAHIEQLPNASSLAHDLPQVLALLEDRSQHQQPTRVDAARAVLQAIASGQISRAAPAEGAIRVAYDAVSETQPAVGFSALLQTLKEAGAIEAERAQEVARRPSWRGQPDAPLAAGAALLFQFNAIETVADAGLLDAVARHFEIYIDEAAFNLVRDLDLAATAGDARAARLASLRSRITSGIERGVYRLLPVRAKSAREETEDEEDEVNERGLVKTLFNVMSGAGPDDMVWVDDRHVSGYPRIDNGLVVGVLEVLHALHASGRIQEAELFEFLRKLRGGGALFIPMDISEVRFHLGRAPLQDGAIVETPALEVIRRSFALGVLNEAQLKMEDNETELKGRPLEFMFAMGNRKLADNLISEIWQSEPDLARARAESEWVWTKLRLDHMNHGESGDSTGPFAAMNVAGLLARAMFLDDLPGEARLSRPHAFMDWITETTIEDRAERDPEFYTQMVKNTRMYVLSAFEGADGQRDADFQAEVRPVIRRWLLLLPASLQQAILAENSFRRSIGFEGKPVITLNDVEVRPRRLWRAARRAVRRGKAKLKSARGEAIEVKRSDTSPRVLHFSGALEAAMTEPALALLDRDSPAVRAEIGALAGLCDVPTRERDAFVENIRIGRPHLIMQRFHKEKEEAVSGYLAHLAERMGSRQSVEVSAFTPPSTAAFLRFLEWPDHGGDFQESAAGVVLNIGAAGAFERLSGLPIALGEDIYRDALAGISDVRLRSPMHGLHCLAAAAYASASDEALGAMADKVMKLYADYGALFVAILLWAAKHFEQRDDWRALDDLTRHVVLWTFADQLTRVCVGARSEAKFATNFFGKLEVPTTMGAGLTLIRGYDDCALDPGCVRLEPLLWFGLMSALPPERWSAVMSPERQALMLEMFGADKPDGGKIWRPVREQVRGVPNWFANDGWRALQIAGLPDGQAIVSEGLKALEANPLDREALIGVVGFGLPAVSEAFQGRIDSVVNAVELTTLADEQNLLALRLYGEAASRLGSGEAAEGFLTKLLALASSKQAEGHAFKDGEQWLLWLLESAAAASKAWERGAGERRMSDFVCKLVEAWPAAAPSIGRLYETAIQNSQAAKSGPLWRPLLVSRLM